MRGITIEKGFIPLQLPEGWHIAATGDFNNDGQVDLVDRQGAVDEGGEIVVGGGEAAGSGVIV